jgi:urease accessory protein
MHRRRTNLVTVISLVVVILTLIMTISSPVEAHHLMGGHTPTTFVEGLLSGFGHPVIGLDHFAFIVAMGIAAGALGLSFASPMLFIIASMVGVMLHVGGLSFHGSEVLVALTVLVAGATIALRRASHRWFWAVLFLVAGLLHGYAFGETIYGAEPSPLVAYLVGLSVIQATIALGFAFITRRGSTIEPRLAGAAIAGIGFAILAGQILPA